MRDINYELLPDYMREGMKLYIEDGIMPGSFLQAVICNDLVGSFAKADDVNIEHMKDYANFLYNEMPMDAWGSRGKMEKWVEKKALEAEEDDKNRDVSEAMNAWMVMGEYYSLNKGEK